MTCLDFKYLQSINIKTSQKFKTFLLYSPAKLFIENLFNINQKYINIFRYPANNQ